MDKKQSDRRIRRTRHLLQEAIVALILEKPYYKVTVQDILDRADVGRSTFYAHFPDKEALLVSGFDDLATDLDHRIEETEESQHLLHAEAFFKHAQERRDFYKAMVEGGGVEIVLETGRRHIEDSIQTHLRQMEVEEDTLAVPLPVLINFLTGSLLSLLTWWIAEDMPYNPDRMADMYEQLVMPGFEGLLTQ
jgi:AcrR family transcriptional regulator